MNLTMIDNKIMPTEDALIPSNCFGFTLSASAFEAVRANWIPNKNEYYLINIRLHLNRLFDSMKLMRMKCNYTKEEILNNVIKLIKQWNGKTDAYIRITAFIKDSSSNGSVYHPDDVTTEIIISIVSKPWQNSLTDSITCCVSSWQRITDASMPPRAKSASNYENTRLAGHEAILNGYDNAILLNRNGKVSEAAESAIFIIDQYGDLITPSLQSDILDSINRKSIMNIWERLTSKKVIERDIDRSELYIAEEIFLCNTAKLIRSVYSVDKIGIGMDKVGPETLKIVTEYNLALRNIKDYFNGNSFIIGN